MDINDNIESLKGVGSKRQSYLHKLNIYTIKDLINHYPIRYINKTKICSVKNATHGENITIKGKVINIVNRKNYKRKSLITVLLKDKIGDNFEAVFFNPKYVVNRLKIDEIYYFFGKIENRKMIHPDFINEKSQKVDEFLRITPVYPLTNGLMQWHLLKMINNLLKELNIDDYESLIDNIVKRNNLCSYGYAIRNIHFPNDKEAYKVAKYRLIFEEFFNIQLRLILLKNNFEEEEGIKFQMKDMVNNFVDNLSFKLTGAQSRVLEEIFNDMQKKKVMNRIIQGDVGSGKTVIAMAALYLSYLNGYQGAFMAPTELLAIQHYNSFISYFDGRGVNVRCLTSSIKNKEQIYKEIENDEVDIVIGTHALLQDKVKFNNLGLIITDEQHRFGVRQREQLSKKSNTKPDVLVMSATPIPRTLSMVIHGDLDISVIDQLPVGRKEISTHYIKKNKKNEMYDFIRKNINEGRQAYFVCPLVEDSEKLDLLSVEKHYYELNEVVFKEFNVEMIHGKLKNSKKDEIMTRFKNGEVDILVSTTVIEVGIDVTNANIMVIENAERFGLSQLHQLRGRVGRGSFQSYCFLLADKLGKISKERIKIMTETNDGFRISEKDLELRGPGDILGIRQSGIIEFKIANIIKNNDILVQTQKEIKFLINEYKSGENKEIIEFVNNVSKGIFKGYKI